MKKLFFSFVMLVTLVIVAGSAKAQVATTVIQGGTYQYTLRGIKVNNAGKATINFEGDNAEVVAVVGTGGFTGTNASDLTAPAGEYDAVFTVHYSTNATVGAANLVVTIKDGSANGCTNTIKLNVTVLAAPVIDLAINSDATVPYCQTANNTTDNTAASKDQNNTIKFTVNPSINNTDKATTLTTFKYGYTIKLPNSGNALGTTGGAFKVMRGTEDVTTLITSGTGLVRSGLDVAQSGTTPSEEYTVTFFTTTGIAAQNLVGSISAVSVKEDRSGGDTYNETAIENNSHSVIINALPSIGQFE